MTQESTTDIERDSGEQQDQPWLNAAQSIISTWFDEIAAPKRGVYIINVCGAAGTGKSSLSRALREVIGRNRCAIVNLDGWMMNREERSRLSISGMHPRAQYFDEAALALEDICRKQKALVPWYNHKTGTRGGFVNLDPTSVVIMDGTVSFYEQYLSFADRGIYLNIEQIDLFCSTVGRDVRERGYTIDGAIDNFKVHFRDYEQFLFPLATRADIQLTIQIKPQFKIYVARSGNH